MLRLAAICFALIGACAAKADAISDFYRGKTVTLVIGYPPGGAYDIYARAIARHLGAKIPGNPAVLIQNMPGAGSLQAANHVANIAAQDGLTLAAVGAALPFAPMLDPQGTRFDAMKINWMPSPASFTALTLVWRTAPAQTFEDLTKYETLMGGLTPGATPSFYAAIINDVFGAKIKQVHGYDSMNSAMLAMQRGETQGYATAPHDSIKRTYAHLLAEKKIRFLLQMGGAPHPDFADVPFILDLAKKAEDRDLIDLALGSLKIGYPYLAGPGVPQERVAALRTAIEALFTDSAFLEDAAKQTLDINPVPGVRVQKIVADAYGAPPAVIERLRGIYQGLMK